ncbi:MAG: pyruvate kinase [Acidimicrobiales bacterium]|jgi:pyruvate kinase|nr:pyruvate kinase [Acidimicrobiales bacterium]
MARRTKIIATVGPASDDPTTLQAMIDAGMDVVRLGLAHGTLEAALERYHRIRGVAAQAHRPVGVLVDLPGPKVRAGQFPEAGATLVDGRRLRLVPGREASSDEVVHVDYDELVTDVHVGDRLVFGDGGVVVQTIDKTADGLVATVLHGGRLSGRPGVHIPADRLRLTTPTAEDLRQLDAFVEAGVDMVALSFVRSAHDVRRVGTEPHPRGPLIVAKIETRAAVENLDGIIEASGAVMVARGDLGAECPIEELPHLQKEIIQRCIALGRPTITATQMLESMLQAPSPTRAEASDVANAVFDGSSALMLSGETAVGVDPVNAVATMARIAERADQQFDYVGWPERLSKLRVHPTGSSNDEAVTDAMTMAAWRAATETDAAAIICLSRSGFTVRSIARFRPQAKILGFSSNERTVRQLTMSWGATPYLLAPTGSAEGAVRASIEQSVAAGEVRRGDLVAVLSGSPDYPGQATDTLRIVRIP